MFAIAIDLTVADAKKHHPKGQRQAYSDIAETLRSHGCERVKWSVFAAKDDDLANLFLAVTALKALTWFGPSVKSIRSFRMELGSDFTRTVKAQ